MLGKRDCRCLLVRTLQLAIIGLVILKYTIVVFGTRLSDLYNSLINDIFI